MLPSWGSEGSGMAEFDVESLFRSLDTDRANVVFKWRLLDELKQAGLVPDDPRVARAVDWTLGTGPLFERGQPVWLDFEQFRTVVREPVIWRALQGELALPPAEYANVTEAVNKAYVDLLPDESGTVAQYIPTLKNVANKNLFGAVLVTTDGQVVEVGDTRVPVSIQSAVKPLLYALALEEHREEEVDKWVGVEPSGGAFNDPEKSLDKDGKPKNAMINAGAIEAWAMLWPELTLSERFGKIEEIWAEMSGEDKEDLRFEEETYFAERATGEGNRDLAKLIASKGKLYGVDPNDPDGPEEVADGYFAACSFKPTARQLGAFYATLANDGVSPYTGNRVFSPETVGRVLAVMRSSGFYDGSGRFGVDVGLPGKTGVGGYAVAVIKGKGAIVSCSPRLDTEGNSVRGGRFIRLLVKEMRWHPDMYSGAERSREAAMRMGALKAELVTTVEQALGARPAPTARRPGGSAAAAPSTGDGWSKAPTGLQL